MHLPERLPTEPFTRHMVLRAIIKGLCLFAAFNVAYGFINPVGTGRLPSLYNVVFPGRVRFMKDYEFDAYRLVSDHVIMTARPDTFNIAILGSSEMWGTRSLADQSVPVILDGLGLVSADGRPVRVYNLGHPVPYGLKDLVIIEAVLRHKIPVDLVLLSTFDSTLSYRHFYHPIVAANFDLQIDVLTEYSLTNAYDFTEDGDLGRSTSIFLQFWEDRSALLNWLYMQMRGFVWMLTRTDRSQSDDKMPDIRRMADFYHLLTLDRLQPPPDMDFLNAFKQLSQARSLPVIILSSPMPFNYSEFAPLLQTQVGRVGLPLLDCWDVFRDPAAFEDLNHIRPETHLPYAQIIAKHLSDPDFFIVGPGLPLVVPPDFAPPPETCTISP